MEFINQIVTAIIESFDFGYCISVNLLTYFIIKSVEEAKAGKRVTTWQKRLCLIISIITLTAVYSVIETPTKILVNSTILAPVSWSWIFKPIIDKFNLGYSKKEDVKD